MRNIPHKGQILGLVVICLILIGGIYRYYTLRIAPAKELAIELTESELSEEKENPPELEEPNLLKVHVIGAVEKPGVYTLEEGKRVDDAVKLAQPTPEADLSLINLAALLQDGRQIYVPKCGEEVVRELSSSDPAGQIRGKVNINKAGVNELDTLSGIGPALAQRIIDYRNEHGPFTSLEEITEVKGIGPVLLEKIRNDITL